MGFINCKALYKYLICEIIIYYVSFLESHEITKKSHLCEATHWV